MSAKKRGLIALSTILHASACLQMAGGGSTTMGDDHNGQLWMAGHTA